MQKYKKRRKEPNSSEIFGWKEKYYDTKILNKQFLTQKSLQKIKCEEIKKTKKSVFKIWKFKFN
jgi:hypothetical protein